MCSTCREWGISAPNRGAAGAAPDQQRKDEYQCRIYTLLPVLAGNDQTINEQRSKIKKKEIVHRLSME